MHGLTRTEERALRRLTTPHRIQDFLERLRYSHDKGADMLRSPRRVLRERSAHCIEGAMLAAAALWINGGRPLLVDLRSVDDDLDHVIAPFRRRGFWGAFSKTNHSVLRYREPIYRTVRELVMSYFNEYYLEDGRKTMRDYSDPYDLQKRHGTSWLTREDDLWDIADALDASRHRPVLTIAQRRELRSADPIEREAVELEVFPEP